jgi:predicted lipoprotein
MTAIREAGRLRRRLTSLALVLMTVVGVSACGVNTQSSTSASGSGSGSKVDTINYALWSNLVEDSIRRHIRLITIERLFSLYSVDLLC